MVKLLTLPVPCGCTSSGSRLGQQRQSWRQKFSWGWLITAQFFFQQPSVALSLGEPQPHAVTSWF